MWSYYQVQDLKTDSNQNCTSKCQAHSLNTDSETPKKNFPLNGGFKLNGGSKPPFSDSGIFFFKSQSQKMVVYERFGTPIDFETPIQAKFV